MKYRKIPEIINAVQWFGKGDHPEVQIFDNERSTKEKCRQCEVPMNHHGWISTTVGGHIVCPTDWIIEEVQGEFYPCKRGIFERTYEPVH